MPGDEASARPEYVRRMGIEGTCDDRFSAVREAFEANFVPKESGVFDQGASVALTIDGELARRPVGRHGRTVTPGADLPWERDTIINVWSTTKTVSALALLILADQGELDLYAPVAKVWPEFAAAGKGGIEVRHVMSHTAGLSGWQEPITYETLYDAEKAAALLAAQEPWWEPGTASGYHAVTQGYLEGEIVRRVTGQTIGAVRGREHHRAARRRLPHRDRPPSTTTASPSSCRRRRWRSEGVDPESVAMRTFSNPVLDATRSWEIPWRRAEIPAAGGHGNARSVALIHTPMACGGEANDVRLLSRAGVDVVFDEQINGTDLVLGIPLRHGIGFGLQQPGDADQPQPRHVPSGAAGAARWPSSTPTPA